MAFTAADLVDIDAALASGALTVAYSDRTITYRSVSELRQARQTIADSIAAAAGTVTRRTFRVQQSGTGL